MKESNHCQPLTSALVAFKKWAEIYVVAPPENRRELPAEGLVLATARGQAMATVTRQDPQAAIQELLPYPLRKTLPLEISARIEHRVSGVGDLMVVAATPLPGGVVDSTNGASCGAFAGCSRRLHLLVGRRRA